MEINHDAKTKLETALITKRGFFKMAEDYTKEYVHKMIIIRLLNECVKKEKNWRGFLAKGSSNNHETNIRFALAELLGESIDEIDLYLCHSEFLTDYALTGLSVSGKGREFFEEVQKVKRNMVKELRHEKRSDSYISNYVSREVLKMAAEWDKKGEITKWHEREIMGAGEMISNRRKENLDFKRQILRPKKKPDSLEIQKGCSPIKIKKELTVVCNSLKNVPVHTGQNLDKSADELRGDIVSLSKLYQKIRFLASQRLVENRRKEAA